MSTNYPGALDNYGSDRTDNTNTKIPASDINNLRHAVVAIENELGVNPKGSKADVKTRIDDIENSVAKKDGTLQSNLNSEMLGGNKAFDFASSYDVYNMWMSLYYSGHFTGPDIAGMRAMTFDGFQDTNRVNTGTSTIQVNTTLKNIYLKNNAGTNNDSARYDTASGSYGGGATFSQTIKATRSGILSMLGIKVQYSSSNTGTLNIYKVTSPTDSGGTLLGGKSITIPNVGTPWADADFSSLNIPIEAGSYYRLAVGTGNYSNTTVGNPGTYADGQFAVSSYDAVFYMQVKDYQSSGILYSSTKSLAFTPSAAKIFISAKIPTNTSIVPVLSCNGGTNYETLTLVDSRTDPQDSNYTEYEYSVTLAYPGTSLIFKSTLTTTVGTATPEIKRYGIQLI